MTLTVRPSMTTVYYSIFCFRELMKASMLSKVMTFDQNNNNLWAERKYVLQYNP